MTLDELIQLDKELLLKINGSDSLFIDGLAMTLTDGVTWIPLYIALLFVVIKNNENYVQLFLIIASAALCVLLAGTLNDEFVKPGICRPRPTHDLEIGNLVDIVDGYRGGHYGFFSSHAANTFSIAIFFSLLIKSRILTFMLITWSLVNCWTRMYLGVHYPIDITCGLLWGGIVGISLYFIYKSLYKRFSKTNNYVSTQFTSSGYAYSDIDIIACVLVLTYLYALIRACFVLDFGY